MIDTTLSRGARRRARIPALSPGQRFGLLALLLLAFGGAVQADMILGVDVSWFVTMDQKWLAGAQLYTQIFEVDPPLSPALYLPALLVSGAAHTDVAIVLTAMMLALACGSALLTDRVLRSSLETGALRLRFDLALLFLFVVFPLDVFGQRDWVAVVSLAPFIAAAGARFQDARLPPWAVALAGFGAGVAMCIKPHYALVAGAPLLVAAIRKRSIRPLFPPEMWTATVVVLVYGAIVALFFPAYLTVNLPKLLLVFAGHVMPMRFRFWESIALSIALIGALALLRSSSDRRALEFAAPWLAAACGGALMFLMIAKWWSYTGYAMAVFGLAPLIVPVTLAHNRRSRPERWAARLLAIAAAIICMSWLLAGPWFPGLTYAVESVAPPHPKIISISEDMSIGHPLVRNLDGEWVGTSAAQAMAAGAIRLERTTDPSPAKRAKLNAVIQSDRERLLDDIEREPPDIILADTRLFGRTRFDWWAWANADPRLAKALANYHYLGAVSHQIKVWKRNGAAGGETLRFAPGDSFSRGP